MYLSANCSGKEIPVSGARAYPAENMNNMYYPLERYRRFSLLIIAFTTIWASSSKFPNEPHNYLLTTPNIILFSPNGNNESRPLQGKAPAHPSPP